MWKTIIIIIIIIIIHTVRIYSQGIGMEFGIEKCDMLVMKSAKGHRMDGKELPNLESKLESLEKKEPTNT